MVGLNNAGDLRYQNWMAQRMMQALAFPEVKAALQELMEQLAQMGMSRERIEEIRELLSNRIFKGCRIKSSNLPVERIAENLSERPPSENLDGLMNRPFQVVSDADKKFFKMK